MKGHPTPQAKLIEILSGLADTIPILIFTQVTLAILGLCAALFTWNSDRELAMNPPPDPVFDYRAAAFSPPFPDDRWAAAVLIPASLAVLTIIALRMIQGRPTRLMSSLVIGSVGLATVAIYEGLFLGFEIVYTSWAGIIVILAGGFRYAQAFNIAQFPEWSNSPLRLRLTYDDTRALLGWLAAGVGTLGLVVAATASILWGLDTHSVRQKNFISLEIFSGAVCALMGIAIWLGIPLWNLRGLLLVALVDASSGGQRRRRRVVEPGAGHDSDAFRRQSVGRRSHRSKKRSTQTQPDR